MFNNFIKKFLFYLEYVKNLVIDFFKFLILIKKIVLDEIFFDSKSREPFRELIKGFLYYIKSNLSLYLNKNLKHLYNKQGVLIKILQYLLKYSLTFIFILWIFFESLFFRFYLVDTPLDTKMFQDRKEFRKSRFIPIIGFEALSFYNRPFWRTFNNIMVFLSNIAAILWIIYYVYILDLFLFLGYFFKFFLNSILFLLTINSFLFIKMNLLLSHFYFFCLIVFWRIFYFLKKICSFFNYIFLLPFYILFNFIDFFFKFLFKLYVFFIICDFNNFFKNYKDIDFNSYVKISHQHYVKSPSYYDKIFFWCYRIERFILYLNFRLILNDSTNYSYFLYYNVFQNLSNLFRNNKFLAFFIYLFMYIYLFICYFLLFLFIIIIFYSYFYLPFFF